MIKSKFKSYLKSVSFFFLTIEMEFVYDVILNFKLEITWRYSTCFIPKQRATFTVKMPAMESVI